MLDASYYEKTDEIIACHTREERSLIPIIQDIQEEYRYLPPELCGRKNWHFRSKGFQRGKFL